MSGSHCPIERQLDEYVDGTLELREMARVRDHLDGCLACARTEAELRRLVQGLGGLAADREPPAGEWDRIASALDAPARTTGLAWWRWRWGLAGVLGTAAAAAVWLVAVAPARRAARMPERVLLAEARHELSVAEEHYATAVRELRELALRERPRWRPEIRRAYDDNLRVIDESIDRFRAAAHRRDAAPAAMDQLLAAYRRQIDYLEEAIARGASSGSELDPL
jgi:hypothetical protein